MFNKKTIRIQLFLLLSCLSQMTIAQRFQFPDENQLDFADDRTDFCKPGVSNKSPGKGILIEYTGIGSFDLSPRYNASDASTHSRVDYMERFKGKFKIPLINAPGLKMMLGYEYIGETYHFSSIGTQHSDLFSSIDDNTLRNNKFSLYVTKSFNEKFYGGLRMRLSSRGDYDNWVSFDDRYTTFSATGLLGIKKSEDLEWGVGLTYSDNFVDHQIWPFAIYNQTFNDKWGIETVLPASIMLRYNFDAKSILLFGAEVENGVYAIDVDANDRPNSTLPFYYRHTEIALKGVFNKNLLPWVWVEAEAGALVPIRSRFEDASDPINTRFRNRTGVSPMLRVGIFVSPPKSMVK